MTANRFERHDLLQEIEEAIAWGVPDRDSVGLSPEAFIRLLSKCKSEIIALRTALREVTK